MFLTMQASLQQVEKLTGSAPRTASADRGYRGITQIGETQIQIIPKPFNDKIQSKYRQRKLKKLFKRRSAIEPVIGHLKVNHRLSRNFYKGIFGDNINVMLSATAFNFKRMMNMWKQIFLSLLQRIFFALQKVFFSYHNFLTQAETTS